MSRGAGKCGLQGYARIVAAIRDEPATAAVLAERLDLFHKSLRTILRTLLHYRIIRIANWEAPTNGYGPSVIIWGLGGSPDAEAPPPRYGKRATTLAAKAPTPKPELIVFAWLWAGLQEGATCRVLHELTGVRLNTVHFFVDVLLSLKLVYVAGWEMPFRGGQAARILKLGNRPNVARPKREARSIIQRRSNDGRQAKRDTMAMISMTAAPCVMIG